jgi:hypothetical protein
MPQPEHAVPDDEPVSLSIHAYPLPGEHDSPERRTAYQEALAADVALRDLLELGCAVAPGRLRSAEDRALGSLLAFAHLP